MLLTLLIKRPIAIAAMSLFTLLHHYLPPRRSQINGILSGSRTRRVREFTVLSRTRASTARRASSTDCPGLGRGATRYLENR